MRQTIREDEWLAELERLSRKNDAGRTSHEWAEQMGKNHKTVLTLLRRAMDLGWLVRGLRTMARLDGRLTSVPVYTIRRPGATLRPATAKTRKTRR